MNLEEKLTALLDSGIRTVLLTGEHGMGKGDFVRRYAKAYGTAVCFPWYSPQADSVILPGAFSESAEESSRSQLFLSFCAGSLAALGERLHVEPASLVEDLLLPLETKLDAGAPLSEEETALAAEVAAWKQERRFFCVEEPSLVRGGYAGIFGPGLACLDEGRRGVRNRVQWEPWEEISCSVYFSKGFFVPENICVLISESEVIPLSPVAPSLLSRAVGPSVPDCFRRVEPGGPEDLAALLAQYLTPNYAASGLPDAAGDARLLAAGMDRLNNLFREISPCAHPRLTPKLLRDLGKPSSGGTVTVTDLWDGSLRLHLIPRSWWFFPDKQTCSVGLIPRYCIHAFNEAVGDRPDLRLPEERI
mgnify:CR=1 FL=1